MIMVVSYMILHVISHLIYTLCVNYSYIMEAKFSKIICLLFPYIMISLIAISQLAKLKYKSYYDKEVMIYLDSNGNPTKMASSYNRLGVFYVQTIYFNIFKYEFEYNINYIFERKRKIVSESDILPHNIAQERKRKKVIKTLIK